MPLSRIRVESYTNLPESSIKQRDSYEWARGIMTSKMLEWGEEALTSRRFHDNSGFLLRVARNKAGKQTLKVRLLLSLPEDWATSEMSPAWASIDLPEFVYPYVWSTEAGLESITFRLHYASKLFGMTVKKNKVMSEILFTGDPAICCQCEVHKCQSISRLESPLSGI